MKLVLFCLIISTHIFGQSSNQPTKESSLDIRTNLVLFSMADLSLEKVIWLERTANLEYSLRMKQKDEVKILKISSREATRIDREFASKFLKCQYELPLAPKDCEATLRLKMKSEYQEICNKEDQKTREINSLFQKLNRLF